MKERILRNIMSSISTNTDPTSNVNLLNQKDNGAQTISNNDVFSVYNWKEELESFKIYLARIQIFFPRHICIFSINLPVNSKLKRNVIFFWSEGGGGFPIAGFHKLSYKLTCWCWRRLSATPPPRPPGQDPSTAGSENEDVLCTHKIF